MEIKNCNQLRASDAGQTVRLQGWIDSIRDHGGILFIDLRDRKGRTQIVFDPENELYECRVPSGRLGIVVDETGIGPRVQKVNVMSKLYKKISVGDIIIAVDEVDLVGAKPDTFWQLVSRKANKQEK